MHWHEWIDDMNELMMKYLNDMTTMKDMNTCMKWTAWPDMKWHDMKWHDMKWHVMNAWIKGKFNDNDIKPNELNECMN